MALLLLLLLLLWVAGGVLGDGPEQDNTVKMITYWAQSS
jgi:hypothetical protein